MNGLVVADLVPGFVLVDETMADVESLVADHTMAVYMVADQLVDDYMMADHVMDVLVAADLMAGY